MAIENEKVEPSTVEKLDAELAASADEIMGGESLVEPEEKDGVDAKDNEAKDAPAPDEKGAGETPTDDVVPKKDDVPGTDNPDAGKTPEVEKADADLPKDEEGKEPTEYTVPEDLAPRSQERFQTLVTATKEARADVEDRDKVITGFREMISNTGLNNKEVDNLFSLGTMIKNDPENAYKTLQGVMVRLAEDIGVAPPGANALAGFDDLQDKVDAGTMSEEDASTVAEARRRGTATLKKQEQEQRNTALEMEQTTAEKKTSASIQTAHDEVKDFLAIKEKDLDFKSMVPHIQEAVEFARENLDPSRWASYIEKDYNRVKKLITSTKPVTPTPLTDASNRGAGDKTPQTQEELADSVFG